VTKRPIRRRPVSRSDVREFVGKAEEWLDTATEAFEHERFTAATGTSIHAGINAADAICGARLGERSAAETHNDAIAMLASIPAVGQDAANLLSRLLQKKHKAEYDPQPISAGDARSALGQAERLVALARKVVAESLPTAE
jgi:uncharacterized protein (UPF0332 family)